MLCTLVSVAAYKVWDSEWEKLCRCSLTLSVAVDSADELWFGLGVGFSADCRSMYVVDHGGVFVRFKRMEGSGADTVRLGPDAVFGELSCAGENEPRLLS